MAGPKSRSSVLIAVAISILLVVSPVHAWWCTGHMAVAEIARRHLDPPVAALVEKMSAKLSASGPFPKNPDFVQLSCWADDLRSYGLRVMGEWHYRDTPYNPENIILNKSLVATDNVVTVLQSLVKTLSGENAPEYVDNFALGNIIHFYGDIHQPLHTSTLVSSQYPEGDQGGNLINVVFKGKAMKLHALWDSMCQSPELSLPRPLGSPQYKKLMKFVDYLEETYKFTDEEKAEKSVALMAKESFKYATTVVYPGVRNGTVIDDEYTKKCKDTAEARVALAGYRLAAQLNHLFADAAPSDAATPPWGIAPQLRSIRRALSVYLGLPFW
ncbi:putative single strand-specific nuclease [Trypanosoma grayi]|uniref:putative single strand-specific nuclease n=1 Tax=Trypanosoma grayi TaxID=71804 RepID=UPI0004F462B9|nr:putative single strand-specific nuclease [Trypanosoma grayi]KEG12305.1 putative single strand-specific nuclease [Trypanosoma grayi]